MQTLKFSLDPNCDGASRKRYVIDKSVEWIRTIFPPEKYPSLLDVRCGTGLYAEKFAKKGYIVVGVDFSHCSIIMRKHATEKRAIYWLFLSKLLELSLKKQTKLVKRAAASFF